METLRPVQQYFQSLTSDVIRLCIWLVILSVIFIPLERLFAHQKQKIFRKEFSIDLSYYFINSLLPKLLLILPISLIASTVHYFLPSMLYTWVGYMSLETRFLLTMIVGEFGVYWGHRLSHEIPLLWRFHAIHHSAKEMDWLVNTRSHPLDMLFTRLCGLLPIYLLGLAQPTGNKVDIVPLIYALVGTVWSFFVHTNMSWRFGVLELLVSTPAFHHWHHTNDGADYINKNYATIFPWMDKLFGTFYLPKHRLPKKYGIDAPMATGLGGQLLQPLEWSRSKLEN